jgi:uncharacterized membrane protein
MPAEGRYAVLHRNSDISSIDAWFEFELVEYVLTQLTWIKLKSEPREIQKAAQSNLRRVD